MKNHSLRKTNRKHKHKKGCTYCKKRHSLRRKMKGGSPSFQPFQSQSNQYYYGLNNHNTDPANPSMIVSSRNLPNIVGGKGRSRRTRRMKGGNPMLYGTTNNMLTNFGNYDMGYAAKAMVSGNQLPSTDIMDQPVFLTYSKYNPPLV